MAFLEFDVSIVGRNRVRDFMRATENELKASNRRIMSEAPSRSRGGGMRSSDDMMSPVAHRVRATQERLEKEKTKAAEREARKRAAAEVALQRQRSAALLSQHKAEERAHAKTEREKTRATEREARQRASSEQALQRQRHTALMAQYRAEEREKRHQARLVDANEKRGRMAWKQATTGILGGTASRVSSVGRAGLAMTGLAGGALFATATHGAMAAQASASNLANQLEGNNATKESLDARKRAILTTVNAVRGVSTEDQIRAMSAFQSVAGEGEATMKSAPMLAKTVLATGGDAGQIGEMYSGVYASLRNAAGGAQKTVDELLKETDHLAMVFAAMGQAGAIELKDFSGIGATVTAIAGQYGGKQVDNIANAAALAQIARQTGGADSAAEAATAISSFSADLVQNGADVRKQFGVDVYSDKSKTSLKELPKLLPELMAATGGNLEKMGEVANIRGMKSLRGFSARYVEAYRGAKAEGKSEKEAKEAGKKAVSARFAEFGGIAMTEAERDTKAASRMSDPDKLFEDNMRKLSTAVGSRLLPVVIELIPKIAEMTPLLASAASSVASLIKAFADNPLSGVGAVIGAAFTAELAKAGLSKVVNDAVSASVNSSIGAGGILTSIAVASASFAITNAVLEIAHQASIERGQSAAKEGNDAYFEYTGKRAEIMASNASPEEKARLLAEAGAPVLEKSAQLQRETSSFIPALASEVPGFVKGIAGAQVGGQVGVDAMLEMLRNIFQSGTERQANEGALKIQQEILRDQAAAAAALKNSAEKIASNLPAARVNTSGAPTVPVK